MQNNNVGNTYAAFRKNNKKKTIIQKRVNDIYKKLSNTPNSSNVTPKPCKPKGTKAEAEPAKRKVYKVNAQFLDYINS